MKTKFIDVFTFLNPTYEREYEEQKSRCCEMCEHLGERDGNSEFYLCAHPKKMCMLPRTLHSTYCGLFEPADREQSAITYPELVQRVYQEFSVYSPWFDELFRNVLDESATFADKETAYDYLNRMLPSELPREWLRRLSLEG